LKSKDTEQRCTDYAPTLQTSISDQTAIKKKKTKPHTSETVKYSAKLAQLARITLMLRKQETVKKFKKYSITFHLFIISFR